MWCCLATPRAAGSVEQTGPGCWPRQNSAPGIPCRTTVRSTFPTWAACARRLLTIEDAEAALFQRLVERTRIDPTFSLENFRIQFAACVLSAVLCPQPTVVPVTYDTACIWKRLWPLAAGSRRRSGTMPRFRPVPRWHACTRSRCRALFQRQPEPKDGACCPADCDFR